MPMNTLRTALLALVVAAAFRAAAQPVYTFRVKVGIDRESVDSLGGRDRVVQLTEDMFRRVNRAFNYGAQLHAVYDFVVDWDAFYIYDGVSADQIRKPHPDHDYLVVMDGYKSDPRETGGGWYGDGIQAIYHSRTHNDRFNSPFEKNAIDGIIHEIGHVFSQGNISGTGRWNWNDEIFANFRMSYALEACDGTMSQRDICYRGADVINYYKIFYDETIGAGIPKNNGDALHYTFLRIKERYGWDVYKKAFRELYALGDSGQEGLETPYDKFLFFLSYVSKAAGEDVVAATYTPGELALIEESLRN